MTSLLASDTPLSVAVPALIRAGAAHNGFNLIAGDPGELLWGSNRAPGAPMTLGPGIYGVSNHLLDTPWPKVKRTKDAFRRWCESDAGTDNPAPVFALLRDTERVPDGELPATGVTLERERILSAPFIISADYGARCSTVLTIDHDGNAHWVERTFDPSGSVTGEVDVRFLIGSEGAP